MLEPQHIRTIFSAVECVDILSRSLHPDFCVRYERLDGEAALLKRFAEEELLRQPESTVIHFVHSLREAVERGIDRIRSFHAQHPAHSIDQTIWSAYDHAQKLQAQLTNMPTDIVTTALELENPRLTPHIHHPGWEGHFLAVVKEVLSRHGPTKESSFAKALYVLEAVMEDGEKHSVTVFADNMHADVFPPGTIVAVNDAFRRKGNVTHFWARTVTEPQYLIPPRAVMYRCPPCVPSVRVNPPCDGRGHGLAWKRCVV